MCEIQFVVFVSIFYYFLQSTKNRWHTLCYYTTWHLTIEDLKVSSSRDHPWSIPSHSPLFNVVSIYLVAKEETNTPINIDFGEWWGRGLPIWPTTVKSVPTSLPLNFGSFSHNYHRGAHTHKNGQVIPSHCSCIEYNYAIKTKWDTQSYDTHCSLSFICLQN